MDSIALKGMFFRKGTFIVLNSLLVIIILFLLLVIMRDMLAGRVLLKKSGPVIENADRSLKGVGQLSDYEVIMERNPFGFDAGRLTALTSHADVKQTTVAPGAFTLIGTIATGGQDSFAVFSHADGKQMIYRVKEHIPGLGTLDRVGPDSVFIKGAQGVQEIELTDIKGDKTGASGSLPSRGRQKRDEFVQRGNDGAYILNEKLVQDSISNPQRLMTDARLFPRYKDGKQEGFVLKEVRKGGIYDNLGLRNGDILLRVNEYDITNPESALQAFTALKGVDELRLDVLRNGATITQTYHIR